jgi:hypothetical protein
MVQGTYGFAERSSADAKAAHAAFSAWRHLRGQLAVT